MPFEEWDLPEISLLYVDDEPALLDIGKMFLERTGNFSVTTAESVKEALKILSTQSFDAIVSDYQMPELSGIDFLKYLRDTNNSTPFLIFTGKSREEVVIEALNEGADFYVQKGGDPKSQFAELAHKIKKSISGKKAEDILKQRLFSLTRPEQELQFSFENLFDPDEIQKIQDEFSELTGVASLITLPDGTPVTKPSRFTRLCKDIIRKTKTGCQNCHKSDAAIGKPNPDGPTVQICLSGGLWDAGVSIIINGQHIANWLAGQIRNEAQSEDKMREYARKIGADEEEFMKAYYEVPSMSYEEFLSVGKILHTVANLISKTAYQNFMQARTIAEKEKTEQELYRKTEELHAAYEELTVSEEELQNSLNEMISKEKELQKSKQELSDIIEFLPDATFVIDREGKVIAWNRATEIMTGVNKKDIIGKGNYETGLVFFNERVPILIDLVINYDEKAVSKYSKIRWEDDKLVAEIFKPEYNTGMGAYFWFTASPLYDSDKKLIGSIECIRDITDRKRAEIILKESENLYRTIFETTGAATIIIEDDTTISMANSGFEELSGFSKEEIENKMSWTDFVLKDDLDLMLNYHKKRRNPDNEGKQVTGTYEFRFIDREGRIHYCLNNVKLIPKSRRSVASFIDITDRKQSEETLLESEKRYRNLIENLHDIVYTLTKEGEFTFVSPAASSLLGFPQGYSKGKSFLDYIHPDDVSKSLEFLEKVLKSGERLEGIEYRIKDAEGSWHWHTSGIVPIKNESGEVLGFEGIARDITDRKIAEESLCLANRKLQILSGITRHDILNLITIVRGALEITKDYAKDPVQIDYLDKIDTAVQKIQRQIEFTREYENLGVERAVWLNIRKLIDKSADDRIKLYNNCENILIKADPMLEKVFANLMDNTIRHGVSATEVHTTCIISDSELKIIWEDNGEGVAESEKEKIFDRGIGKNTGFGLFLTREILSTTGITVKETGKEGQGARFEIIVPIGAWRFSARQ